MKYLIVIIIVVALVSCNKKTTENPTPKTAATAIKYSIAEIDSILRTLNYSVDTAMLHQLFINRNKLGTNGNEYETVSWEMKLAKSVADSGLDQLAIEIYDSVYAAKDKIKSDSNLQIIRSACYEKGQMYANKSEYKYAQTEFEKYFSLEPKITKLYNTENLYSAGFLGDIYLRLGDNKKSGYYYSWGFWTNYAKPFKEQFGGCYNDMVVYYNSINNFDSALWFGKKGLALPGMAPFFKGLISTNLSKTFLEKHQYNEAIKNAVAFMRLVDTSTFLYKRYSFEMRASYAEALAGNLDYKEAILEFKKAVNEGIISQGSDKTREFSKLYKSFGDCYLKGGEHHDSAMYYYHKALASVVKTDSVNVYALPNEKDFYPENAIQEALDAKADWWLSSKKPDKLQAALKAMELAMKADDQIQQQFSFDASKLAYQRLKKMRSAKAIAVCYELYKKEKNEDWIKKAWAFSEAAKATVLRDAIKKQMGYQKSGKDTLVQQLNWLQQELTNHKIRKFESEEMNEQKTIQESLDSLEAKYIYLSTKLKISNPSATQLFDTLAGKNVLENKLFENVPVIEFFAADSGKYYIFYKNEKGDLRLENCQLHDTTLSTWLSFFKNSNTCDSLPIEFQKQAFNIYNKLLLPFVENKNYETLIIIPDAILWQMPWDALVTKNEQARAWESVPFLVNNVVVTLGFSLENLAQQYERKQEQTTDCIVAFAPAFTNKERGQQPLLFSLTELAEIKKIKDCGKFITGNNATISSFESVISNSEILHISTHATSGDMEDACQLQFYDSTLYLPELYLRMVNAKLVVLSACETSLGKFENGEGVYSMARGFYLAGAKNVVTSLWQINDQSTATLFKNFYSQTEMPHHMLHKAILQYLKENGGSNTSPYYWAAFVNTGYTPAKKTSNTLLWIAIGAAICIALFYGLSKKKNINRAT